MKIIVTAVSPSIDSGFDQRFGRCANFVVVDSDTMEWKAFPNPALSASGGAGTQAAQFAAEQQAGAVISGDFGPNAAAALNAAGIAMYLYKGDAGVKDAVQGFTAGKLEEVSMPTTRGRH